jgi:predicted Rossmann-fold nucleotide-binding protein
VRLQLELLKPELLLQEHGVVSTVVVFGSARIPAPEDAQRRLAAWEALARQHPDSPRHREQAAIQRRLAEKAHWYEVARRFGRLISELGALPDGQRFMVMTGGGGGIMEAAPKRPAPKASGSTSSCPTNSSRTPTSRRRSASSSTTSRCARCTS